MKPERILADLRQAAANAILVTDVGWNKNGMAQQYPIDEPSSFITPGGFSTMGFGPAAVLGVAAAGTGRPAIALVGDGGFGAQPNVLATAVEMGIAPIWVVMNNASFGTIAGLERKHYGTSYGCDFKVNGRPYTPDFAAMARACGAEGWRVETTDDLLPTLQRAVAARSARAHRRPDGEHACPDAGIMGHRAHLSRRRGRSLGQIRLKRTFRSGGVNRAAYRRGSASHAPRSAAPSHHRSSGCLPRNRQQSGRDHRTRRGAPQESHVGGDVVQHIGDIGLVDVPGSLALHARIGSVL